MRSAVSKCMSVLAPPSLARFANDGYAVIPGILPAAEIDVACAAAAELFSADRSARAGVRDPVLRSESLKAVAALPVVRELAEAILGESPKLVRSILFDKNPQANWDVAWHQDITIAVKARHDVPGFGPWSTKAGVTSVQPPAAVLERMLTIRLHLDACPADNGPLLVVPGSHRNGVLAVESIDPAACDRASVACIAQAGNAVLMRPLTLHASKKSANVAHRRVLHLDFAADPLPSPLEWFYAL